MDLKNVDAVWLAMPSSLPICCIRAPSGTITPTLVFVSGTVRLRLVLQFLRGCRRKRPSSDTCTKTLDSKDPQLSSGYFTPPVPDSTSSSPLASARSYGFLHQYHRQCKATSSLWSYCCNRTVRPTDSGGLYRVKVGAPFPFRVRTSCKELRHVRIGFGRPYVGGEAE